METRSDTTSGEFIVAGGGIGGIATALALARQGRKVRVLERAAELGEIGYGLQLGPNAYRMLEHLGVADQLKDRAFFPNNLVMIDAIDGRELTRMALGSDFQAKFGYPYSVIHRSDLHQMLLDAVRDMPGVSIETSKGVQGFTQNSDGVEVTCEDGSVYHGTALIGADGLKSRVRATILDDGAPRVAGQVAYRGVVPMEEITDLTHADDVVLWVGPNLHMVQYRLRGGKVMNNVAVVENDDLRLGRTETIGPDEMERIFAPCTENVRKNLGYVRKDRNWVLYDRDPKAGWSQGRATLLGDAAHPTLQYMAQGACMALEDAAVLADKITTVPSLDQALVDYEHARYLRTGRIQLTSRFFCGICHAGGGARDVRNSLVENRPKNSTFEIDWLYSGIVL
ncbi:salicylate hydroxylase [Pigmentiphaga litoralis]|jgi:salicylate hydroxylase|uniref:FAD-dependent monooxygenase n=1 Tax=Pigmentiphaga litoralis TaxID=516702 RepID=UPI00167B113E|nr:FAD-dependent monooxygenase [Pigmentiphaga litoralis]GGX25283.1 salicylate hydroxylase [Pigmentiphaga litoralis]